MKHWVLLLELLVGILGNAGFAQGIKIPLPDGAVARLGVGKYHRGDILPRGEGVDVRLGYCDGASV